MGCGSTFAYFYAITFQFFFAIIVINLFVAVILAGHEETSRLDEANLSDFYLETFKTKWSMFDTKARGVIKVKDLIKFLARIELPFDVASMHMAIMKMYLPIIQVTEMIEPDEDDLERDPDAKPHEGLQLYYLFNDVLTAITHLSTEKNIRAMEIRKLNMKNQIQK